METGKKSLSSALPCPCGEDPLGASVCSSDAGGHAPMVQPESWRRIVIVGEDAPRSARLNKLLIEQTGYACETRHKLASLMSEVAIPHLTLWLVDAGLVDDPGFAAWLAKYKSDTNYLAFVNAVPESRCEWLITEHCVRGIFYDGVNDALLLKGVAAIFAGECWFTRRLLMLSLQKGLSSTASPAEPSQPSPLSSKEWRILTHVLHGYSNKYIADRLHISEHTVKSHLYNIYKKINARNRTQAANWAKKYVQ